MRSSKGILAVGLALGLAACGGTPSRPRSTATDAGSTHDAGASGCTDDTQCPSGESCIAQRCGTCDGYRPPTLACPIGTVCNHVSHGCEARLDGGGTSGSSGSSGTTGSSGTSTTGTTGSTGQTCVHRADCPGADACPGGADGGTCTAVDVDAGCSTNDGCDKGFICQAHQCVAGCYNNLDCHGTDQPVCNPGNPGSCGPCTVNTDCFSTEVCQSGQCVAKQSCTDASTCGDLACLNGYCSACATSLDCGSGRVCDPATGHCSAQLGCTSDSECQSQHGSLAWYCGATPSDGGVAQCAIGCVPDSQCGAPQPGCCALSQGMSCDGTSHTCVSVGTTTGGTTTSTSTSGTTTSTSTSGTSTSGTSTTGSGTTTGGSTTGTTTGSTTTTGGTTGSTLQPICGSCTASADCQSGFCNDYGAVPFCDSADACTQQPNECPSSASCDSNWESCSCPALYYCAQCYADSDCGTGGYCLGTDGLFTAGNCTTPCQQGNSCPEPGASCFNITQAGQTIGKGCYPTSQTCP